MYELSIQITTTLFNIADIAHNKYVQDLNANRGHGIVAQAAQRLTISPAVARIVTIVNNSERHYYISNAMPVDNAPNNNYLQASYKSPVGRLATLDIGDEMVLPNGEIVQVLQKSILNPQKNHNNTWDSINTVVYQEIENEIKITTIKSLTEIINTINNNNFDLDFLNGDDVINDNIIDGIRRNLIENLALRSQPILDRFQDNIYRQPINSIIFISGPPGTGKTTTLIKRLGLKLDANYLQEDESNVISRVNNLFNLSGRNEWLMFTPTTLLALNLSEMFNHENIAAGDTRLRTWENYSQYLAQNVFTILATVNQNGFIYNNHINNIDLLKNSIEIFEVFFAFNQQKLIEKISTDFELDNILEDNSDINELLYGFFNVESLESKLIEITRVFDKINNKIEIISDEINQIYNNIGRCCRNNNSNFLQDLINYYNIANNNNNEELLEVEGNLNQRKFKALLNYLAKNPNQLNKNVFFENFQSAEILNLMQKLNSKNLLRKFLRKLATASNSYFKDISVNYRIFRNQNQNQNNVINQHELDILLLTHLKSANKLLRTINIQNNLNNSFWNILQPVISLFKNQILVDEATDFSPIQLACMFCLATPGIDSFSACGDFNQRLTLNGIKNQVELDWVFNDITANKNYENIINPYRQSHLLQNFSQRLINENINEIQIINTLNNVPPVLLEYQDNVSSYDWIADRIVEVIQLTQNNISIAILVHSEESVTHTAKVLNNNNRLRNFNIQIAACVNGQILGNNHNVRVFNIKHIKGLEFEAVFFLDINRVFDLHPTLFEKYLYVGVTRAASFLGFTCNGTLPDILNNNRNYFVNDWNNFVNN